MSIFSGLFRSRDKPKDATTGSSYRFFFGGTTSGKAVTERSAMQMTAVYSCVRILSEAIAGLPIHLYRYSDGDSKEKATDHPLYFLLHDEPNPEMTSFVFRETLMTHLLLWGNAYAQIIRNGKGEVVALYPLMPNRMTVNRDERGELYYEYQTSQDEAHTMDGSRRMCCTFPALVLTVLLATARLQWPRTLSAWRLPVKNMALSSLQMARHPAASWSIPVW